MGDSAGVDAVFKMDFLGNVVALAPVTNGLPSSSISRLSVGRVPLLAVSAAVISRALDIDAFLAFTWELGEIGFLVGLTASLKLILPTIFSPEENPMLAVVFT